jgi:hypothetical protein
MLVAARWIETEGELAVSLLLAVLLAECLRLPTARGFSSRESRALQCRPQWQLWSQINVIGFPFKRPTCPQRCRTIAVACGQRLLLEGR